MIDAFLATKPKQVPGLLGLVLCRSLGLDPVLLALPVALTFGIGIAWAGLSYEEQLSGSKSAALYIVALLMVFLCLAALYES